MKKKKLHSLHIQKSTISSLQTQAITGGTIVTFQNCPVPIVSATTCSQFAKCDSKQICSAHICKPIHDTDVPAH